MNSVHEPGSRTMSKNRLRNNTESKRIENRPSAPSAQPKASPRAQRPGRAPYAPRACLPSAPRPGAQLPAAPTPARAPACAPPAAHARCAPRPRAAAACAPRALQPAAARLSCAYCALPSAPTPTPSACLHAQPRAQRPVQRPAWLCRGHSDCIAIQSSPALVTIQYCDTIQPPANLYCNTISSLASHLILQYNLVL